MMRDTVVTCVAQTRLARALAIALTVVMLGFFAVELVVVYQGAVTREEAGADFAVHLAVAQRWLDTGVLYSPSQFAPYTNVNAYLPGGVANLYPPPAVLLFVPFLVLPALLWWAIPLGVIAWGVWYWRPAWWSWPILAALMVPLPWASNLTTGNTTLWATAAIMLATRWPVAAIFLAIKPTIFPLALLFARSRAWWIGAAVAALAALPFGEQWFEWLRAAQNLQGSALLYSVPSLPLLVWPLVVRRAATDR